MCRHLIFYHIHTHNVGVSGEMVTVVENGHGDPTSNPRRVIYISHRTNTFGTCMNSIILFPTVGKQLGRLFSLWQPVKKTGNSKSKPVQLRLEIDPVSHHTRSKWLSIYMCVCVSHINQNVISILAIHLKCSY